MITSYTNDDDREVRRRHDLHGRFHVAVKEEEEGGDDDDERRIFYGYSDPSKYAVNIDEENVGLVMITLYI